MNLGLTNYCESIIEFDIEKVTRVHVGKKQFAISSKKGP